MVWFVELPPGENIQNLVKEEREKSVFGDQQGWSFGLPLKMKIFERRTGLQLEDSKIILNFDTNYL